MERVVESACAAFNIRRAARLVTQAYDRALAPCGLGVGQYSLMRIMSRLGPRSHQDVAYEMGLDRTTLGRNLQPLVRAGLVTVAVNPRDRRGRCLTLTAAGVAKIAEAEPLWRTAQTMFERGYGEEQTVALVQAMRTVANLTLAC